MEQAKKIAIVRGKDLPISTKHAVALCAFIKRKNPQEALILLEKVIRKKIAVPMKGKIAHKRNMPKGKPSGRYPIKASKEFIKLIKNLVANAIIKGLNTDALIITVAKADIASRRVRATRIAYGRKRFKRTHVFIEASEKEQKPEEKKEKIEEEKKK